MLALVSRQSGSGPGVALVRESEWMSRPAALTTLRVVVGQFGGLSSIARPVSRRLRELGATVISTDEYEAAAQAAAANRFGATVYIGLEARADSCSIISYFAVPTFESIGGRMLGAGIAERLRLVLGADPQLRGMRLPVLRETRMPAVLCSLGPVRDVVDKADPITEALVSAVRHWSSGPAAHPID